ncbi:MULTISPECIES: DUF3363 domain-containing protein [Sphingobium]|uniref:DUF3363 domain-containing protein n=1 Tax=Sphingobium sp. MI1205 TaxID=407020 RepID=UPI00077005DC|nr:DUF3363 domain-containing protein [Sphingobium sp. MI1205]AMK16855.1 type IV secretory pathway VirD2 component [Sphingobium sp. MI1205]
MIYRRNLLRILGECEVWAVAGQLSKELGLPFETNPSERVEGALRRKVNMTPGRVALIERSHEFTLVPWRDELERHVGKQLSGLMREDRSSR